MKRLLYTPLSFIVLAGLSCGLLGCSVQSADVQPSEDVSLVNAISSENQLGVPPPLSGFSLKDLKLDIIVPEDVAFKDPNIDFEMPTHFEVWEGHPSDDLGSYMKEKLYGNYTYVCALTVESHIAVMELPVIFLQGFLLEEMEKNEAAVMVGQRRLTAEELHGYEVYRDERAVVYNLSSLLMTDSFDDYIKIHNPARKPSYDYSWTKDVYIYFQNNIAGMIVPE